jgi:hypothetical protein
LSADKAGKATHSRFVYSPEQFYQMVDSDAKPTEAVLFDKLYNGTYWEVRDLMLTIKNDGDVTKYSLTSFWGMEVTVSPLSYALSIQQGAKKEP